MRLTLLDALQKVQAHPNSWLQVTRADVRERIHAPDAGTRLFERLKKEQWICQDAQEHMYVYRQARSGNKSISLIAAMEMSPDTESALVGFQSSSETEIRDSRIRDEELNAHAEIPVLAFHPHEELSDLIKSATIDRPLTHFVGKDGATHSVWSCKDVERTARAVGQLKSLVSLSGDGVFSRSRNSRANRVSLRAVAITAIEQVSLRASRLVVSGGDEGLLLKRLMEFQSPIEPETHGKMGVPPAGCFDAYMAGGSSNVTNGAAGSGSWMRGRMPPRTPGHSAAANWDRARFDRCVITPWMDDCPSRGKIQIQSMNAVFSLARLAKMVDAGEAQAVIVFPNPSMHELLEIAKGKETIPHDAISFSPSIPSGLFIQSIA